MPVPLSDAPQDCMRLASRGEALYNLTVALDAFASHHCIQNLNLSPRSAVDGGLSYYCETRIRVDHPVIVSPLTCRQAVRAV